MTDTPTLTATLYDSTYYQGNAVTVRPDGWDESEGAVAYSLAYLGLARLGSLKAPAEPADPDNPLQQQFQGVTHVTVWASKPVTSVLDTAAQGTTWQQYSADTADLGAWAAKARYVRVWKQTTDADPFAADGATLPISIVE
ncbi:hypothetical protein ABZZ20_31445 [Streptomyces sp. NPDC006430]|uniref:hypothetical protein n=1 Tax=Streptomyces sp. NPDC006430 TaxID=3154299 RepID=UPI0033B6F61A